VESLNRLVSRAREGDVSAYGRLVRSTERLVFGVALRVLRDEALAEDAAQETFLRAFRRIGDLEEDAAFLTWLAHRGHRGDQHAAGEAHDVPAPG